MIRHVTVNARDPYTLGTFWAAALGGRLQDDDLPGDPAALVTSSGPPLLFEQAEGTQVHLDLQPDLPRAQEVARLTGLGAVVVADRTRPDGSGWVVMADPEGNPFCVERSAAERGQEAADDDSPTAADTARPPTTDTGERPMPPIHAADERTMLTGMLEWYREGVLQKVAGLTPAGAAKALPSGTTIAGLVKHLALVEDHWATHGLGREPLPEPWASAPFDDDPDWEFHSADDLADAVDLYRAACDRSRTVLAAHGLDEVRTNARGREFTTRFVLLHLLEETARHLGHLDVLRELADGVTGE